MRTYKEYLIPETINHEELRYLVSIGSKVLVKVRTDIGSVIVNLIPGIALDINYNFSPLSHSDIILLEKRSVDIYGLYYKIS